MTLDLQDHGAFLQAVEDATLPAEAFDHRAHLRLAWICLRQGGEEPGTRIAALIRAFAEAKGASGKFNPVLTRVWTARVGVGLEAAPGDDFDAFLALNAGLLRPTPSA